MNKTVLVMVSEIGRTLRRWQFSAFAFGLPILMGIVVLIISTINRDAGRALPSTAAPEPPAQSASQGLVDPGDFVKRIPDEVPEGRIVEFASEDLALSALDDGAIAGYFVVPENYIESGELIFVQHEYNPFEDDVESDTMGWILMVNLLGDQELAVRAGNPMDVQVTRLKPPDLAEGEDSWIVEMMPTLITIILYMVILLPSGVLVAAITDEKKNRVLEVLMSSVSTRQLIAGKILGVGVLGLLETGIWVGTLWLVVKMGGQPLNIPPGFELPTGLLVWALIYFLTGYMMYGALLAGVGALAPDVKDTRGASMLVMSPLIVTYTFNVIVITRPQSVLATVLSLFPLTSPVAMTARMTATDLPLWQPALAAALQLVTAIVIVRVVARLFRAQHLLSGQQFNVRSYTQALLGRA